MLEKTTDITYKNLARNEDVIKVLGRNEERWINSITRRKSG